MPGEQYTENNRMTLPFSLSFIHSLKERVGTKRRGEIMREEKGMCAEER